MLPGACRVTCRRFGRPPSGAGDRLAGGDAAAAGFGAALAMLGFVLGTFGGAGLAEGRAKAAQVAAKTRFTAAKCGAQPAEIGAVATMQQAIGHFGARPSATVRNAALALFGTGDALVDTLLSGFVRHGRPPMLAKGNSSRHSKRFDGRWQQTRSESWAAPVNSTTAAERQEAVG